MYLHLGLDKIITFDEILGIFDLDNTTVQKASRDYLAKAEKSGIVENVCLDLPKSFVVTETAGQRKVYITQISSTTLLKRTNMFDYLK
ncbi:MAG: DUF370 domain-containing protein [Clostridia bacterium]|nr:DUF370 domain-containing protein [Clostridia bacterium]